MLLSGRIILPALLLAGLSVAVLRRRYVVSSRHQSFCRLTLLYTLPFLFAFLRNDMPLDRSFVPLSPVFALLLASGATFLLESPGHRPEIRRIVATSIALYCLVTCVWTVVAIQRQFDFDLLSGKRHQDLLRNSYLSRRFTPRSDIESISRVYRQHPAPIIVMDDVDRVAVYYYLNKTKPIDYFSMQVNHSPSGKPQYMLCRPAFGIGRECENIAALLPRILTDDESGLFIRLFSVMVMTGTLTPHSPCYVITACPQRFIRLLSGMGPDFNPVRLNARPSFTTPFALSVPPVLHYPK